MNLILFSDADKLDGNHIRLTGARLQHLREVIDASEGDALRVGEIGGNMGTAELQVLSEEEAVLEVELNLPPPPKLELTLILALPRPKMLRRILRTVAELGVPELHLLNSYRVEKSYWQTPVLQENTVRDYFLQGLQQSRDTVLPRLYQHRRFKPFVEDELEELIAGRRALLAHPGNYPECPSGDAQATVLFIGPEGGFIPYEVEKLEQADCKPVSLGPRILRVENAVTTLVTRLA
jgi:16S rRNA (uracil1498-N3)-methyltransferase